MSERGSEDTESIMDSTSKHHHDKPVSSRSKDPSPTPPEKKTSVGQEQRASMASDKSGAGGSEKRTSTAQDKGAPSTGQEKPPQSPNPLPPPAEKRNSLDSLLNKNAAIINLDIGNHVGGHKVSDEVTLRKKGYVLGKVLGEGAYAKVYLAEFGDAMMPKKKQALACKVIDGDKAPRDFIKKFFPRELNLMCKVNHHYIVRIHSILKLSGRYFLFMTYCENGDLLSFMKENGAVREPRARRWFTQMVEGLDYLHGKNIAHRDLKCENILLNGSFNVKIADFGFARLYQEGEEKSSTFCGSVMYAPPEVVHGNPYDPKLADVWSIGVVLFIMLNKSMPFDDSSLRKLYECQMSRAWKIRNKLKDVLSQEVKTFLYIMLEPIPDKRRSLAQIRRDAWIMRGSFSESTLRNPSKGSIMPSLLVNDDTN